MRFVALVVGTVVLSTGDALGQEGKLNFKPAPDMVEAPGPAEVVVRAPVANAKVTLPDHPLPKAPASSCAAFVAERRKEYSPWLAPAVPRPADTDVQGVRRRRVADKKFWFVTAATVGSGVLHAFAVRHCRNTVGIESCEGRYGPFGAIQGVNIGFSALMAGMGYWWKKSDAEDGSKHSLWWTIPAGTIAFNGGMALQQYVKHCPAGTRFNGDGCR